MNIKRKMRDLHSVLTTYNSKHHSDAYLDQTYNELFNANWLKPETAIYYFKMITIMHKLHNYFEEPILDLGCGNGTFMTIFCGGFLDKTTDVYEHVDLTKKDIYDNYTPSKTQAALKKPDVIIYGVEKRENLVKSARDLKSYKEVKVGDVRNLPFKDNMMGSVYSNMINDIKDEDLSKVFKEIYRVLKDSGFVIFTTPTIDFLDSLYYGKSIWKPRSLEFWKEFLENQSFDCIIFEPFMDKKLLQFWDTGFRPYFSELMEFRKLLRYKEFLPEVKSLYVEILKNYFFNYVNKPLNLGQLGFALIVARKVIE